MVNAYELRTNSAHYFMVPILTKSVKFGWLVILCTNIPIILSNLFCILIQIDRSATH